MEPEGLQLSVMILLTCFTAISALQLLWGNATEESL